MAALCRFCMNSAQCTANSPVLLECLERNTENIENLEVQELVLRYLAIKLEDKQINESLCSTCRLTIKSWHYFHEMCRRNNDFFEEQLIVSQSETKNISPKNGFSISERASLNITVDTGIGETKEASNVNETPPKAEENSGFVLFNLSEKDIDQLIRSDFELSPEKTDAIAIIRENLDASISQLKEERQTVSRSGICEICGAFRRNLSEHLRVHRNERRFLCPHCSASFVNKANFHHHLNIHTKRKVFECNACDKIFSTLDALKQHQQVHTKVRPYTCTTCGVSYAQSTTLSRHKRTHLEDPKHCCVGCEKVFRTKDALAKHAFTHTNEKPFECNICHRTFSRKDNLQTHLILHVRRESKDQHVDNGFEQ